MAYRDNPTSEEWVPTAEEEATVEQLCRLLDLSRAALLRQALRGYQLATARLQAGETCTWSGDAERARQFAGPLAVAQPATCAQLVDWLMAQDCESFTTGLGSCYYHGRSPTARDGADTCCPGCVAQRVAEGLPMEPTDAELVNAGRTRESLHCG